MTPQITVTVNYETTQRFPVLADGTTGRTPSLVALDGALASAASTPAPLLAGGHYYSGNRFPTTFAGTNAHDAPAAGYDHSIINVKCDWTQLANGGLDSHINGFIDSIPAGHVVYLIINHEPENDTGQPGHAVWQDGQARAGNVIAAKNDPRCVFATCLMSYTWNPYSHRNPNDWNPAAGPNVSMTPAALARTIFTIDVYTAVLNQSGTKIDTLASKVAGAWDSAHSWGFTRVGISEHALNNTIGAPIGPIVAWWNSDHIPYLRSVEGLEYYAFFNQNGPASGDCFLDTPEELGMFGQFCIEQNR